MGDNIKLLAGVLLGVLLTLLVGAFSGSMMMGGGVPGMLLGLVFWVVALIVTLFVWIVGQMQRHQVSRNLRVKEEVMETLNYVIARDTDLPFGQAIEKARGLLREAAHGILSEIAVKAKLEEKLSIGREPYVILGTCKPPLARQGLDAEPDLGALLPCDVIVYEKEERTRVAAVEPGTMLSVVGNEKVGPIAERVREDLARVVEEVGQG